MNPSLTSCTNDNAQPKAAPEPVVKIPLTGKITKRYKSIEEAASKNNLELAALHNAIATGCKLGRAFWDYEIELNCTTTEGDSDE